MCRHTQVTSDTVYYMRSTGYTNIVSYFPHSTYVDFIWKHPVDFTGKFMKVCDSAMAVYSLAITKLTDDCWLLQ